MPAASQPTISTSMMQSGTERSASRMIAKRPEICLPFLLKMTTSVEARCSCARQPSCFTSCSQSGLTGGAERYAARTKGRWLP